MRYQLEVQQQVILSMICLSEVVKVETTHLMKCQLGVEVAITL